MVPDGFAPNGGWKYWYLASPHMKDICKSLNELQEKYADEFQSDFQIISVTMNHQNYIVLYRYWEESKNESDNGGSTDGNTGVHSGDPYVDIQSGN